MKKVEQSGTNLEILRKCHTRLFKAPPKEWIEERVFRIQGGFGTEGGEVGPAPAKISTPVRVDFRSEDNPFAGRRNKLTPRQRRTRDTKARRSKR